MSQDLTFSLNSITFDESYQPLDGTRLTTNFANLARGEGRQQNLRKTLKMINKAAAALGKRLVLSFE